MNIYVYSLQEYIGEIICDHLTEKGHLCINFKSQNDFSCTLMRMKTKPDLLVLDYTFYNHDDFDIYEDLKEKGIILPLIFYNDPCLTMSTRSRHWKSQILLNQNFNKTIKIENYEPLFQDLQELVESEELSPYITLMQKPAPLPDFLIPKKMSLNYIKNLNSDCITDFKTRSGLSNNLFYLLSILQKHKEIALSLSDIQKIYERDGKHISQNSLKVLISKLRGKIREDRQCKFIIRKVDNLYQFIRFVSA